MKNMQKTTMISIPAALILVLYFLTNIVLAFPQNGYYLVKESTITDLENLNSNLTFRVDSYSRNDDLRQTVEFTGYAYFAPTISDITDKKILLILLSSEDTYIVGTDLSDIFYLRDQLSQSKVEGTEHGFRTTFSPLGMANGVYELYIYCYENEGNVGYIKTDKVFIKHYGEFLEQGSISPEGQN